MPGNMDDQLIAVIAVVVFAAIMIIIVRLQDSVLNWKTLSL